MNVLVISAHPDDEVIGAGGTIARHVAEGDKVDWCVVTQAYTPEWSEEDIRLAREEALEVKRVLGIQDIFFLGFPTVKLNTVPSGELNLSIQKVVNSVRPHTVYTTPRDDINSDHQIVHNCTLVATRPLPGSSVRRVLSYEISPTSRFGIPSGALNDPFNVFVDISGYLDTKLKAMSCYTKELRAFPHPRSLEGIRLFAQERGLCIGLEAAESFRLVREIR